VQHADYGLQSAQASDASDLWYGTFWPWSERHSQSWRNIDDAVKTSPVPGVWVLPAGAPVDDPTLLLAQRLPKYPGAVAQKDRSDYH